MWTLGRLPLTPQCNPLPVEKDFRFWSQIYFHSDPTSFIDQCSVHLSVVQWGRVCWECSNGHSSPFQMPPTYSGVGYGGTGPSYTENTAGWESTENMPTRSATQCSGVGCWSALTIVWLTESELTGIARMNLQISSLHKRSRVEIWGWFLPNVYSFAQACKRL